MASATVTSTASATAATAMTSTSLTASTAATSVMRLRQNVGVELFSPVVEILGRFQLKAVLDANTAHFVQKTLD